MFGRGRGVKKGRGRGPGRTIIIKMVLFYLFIQYYAVLKEIPVGLW